MSLAARTSYKASRLQVCKHSAKLRHASSCLWQHARTDGVPLADFRKQLQMAWTRHSTNHNLQKHMYLQVPKCLHTAQYSPGHMNDSRHHSCTKFPVQMFHVSGLVTSLQLDVLYQHASTV